MEQGGSEDPLPSSGSNWSDSEQACPDRSAADTADTRLATENEASVSYGNGDSGGASADTGRQEVGGTLIDESRLASAAVSSEHVIAAGVRVLG